VTVSGGPWRCSAGSSHLVAAAAPAPGRVAWALVHAQPGCTPTVAGGALGFFTVRFWAGRPTQPRRNCSSTTTTSLPGGVRCPRKGFAVPVFAFFRVQE